MKSILVLALLVSASLACTEGSPPPKSPAATILQAPAPTGCPLGVPDTRVVFAEAPQGGTLTFLTGPDRVEDLRERARDAAAQHGPGQRVGKGHDGRHGSGGEHGIKSMQMPPAYAAEDDIEGGARLRFTAATPEDVDAIRSQLRARAPSGRHCPIHRSHG